MKLLINWLFEFENYKQMRIIRFGWARGSRGIRCKDIQITTVSFTDLGKLNLATVQTLWAQADSTTAPAASKNDACFKCGQNRLENNHLGSEILIRDTLCSCTFCTHRHTLVHIQSKPYSKIPLFNLR